MAVTLAEAVTLAPNVCEREELGDTDDDREGDAVAGAVLLIEAALERETDALEPKDTDGEVDGVTGPHCT